MKKKRSLFKTILLLMVRYYRWKENPKNADAYYWMNFNKPKNFFN